MKSTNAMSNLDNLNDKRFDDDDNEAEDQNKEGPERDEGSKVSKVNPKDSESPKDKLKCRVCHKKFSKKDNRRRHERTICLAKRNTMHHII